jgi:pimeloyl-ACP methyl ester carboxylesterase
MRRPILLVHGAFHTGACWGRFAPYLVRRGFEVHTVTLGGHTGNPRNPLEVSMQTYGDDVIVRAEQIGHPCILLGHSMGGMVISEAAERRPELFSSLIYLTAFAPPFGASNVTELSPVSPLMAAAPERGPDGTVVVAPETANKVFYNRCTPEAQAFAAQHLSPQPGAAGRGAVHTTRARLGGLPKSYIECTDDAALPIESQRALQANMAFGAIRTLDSDHSPFLSAPDALADAIAAVAGQP